jgi:acetate kinase
MNILVLNAGSSTLKLALFDADSLACLGSGLLDWTEEAGKSTFALRPREGEEIRSELDVTDHRGAARHAIPSLLELGAASGADIRSSLLAVGHRVVHGGTQFRESVRLDADVKKVLAEVSALAPLHNPPALETIDAAQELLPDVPHIGMFDTSFYTYLPPRAYVYALPYEWYTIWGIRRFGFHGISHAYCASRAAQLLDRSHEGFRVISCHLGNGCSATAVRSGIAVATTMGFTPLEGLMMGTRSGSIDPGILLHVQKERGLSVEELDHVLNHESGLLGVSGVSSDCRRVEDAARQGDERALLALEIYAARVREAIGALAVELGGVDALVFTGGVGENSASVRGGACKGLECLGLHLDPERNKTSSPDAEIALAASTGRIFVIHTREEEWIAREIRRKK